ncbi:MAG: hypothetical protein ACYS4W_00035 [Planctomycetota bacterium]|jgi:hypothetical protein
MTKRIQCRVVKSVPLNRANHTFQAVSTSNPERPEIEDSVDVNTWAETAGIYMGRSGAVSASINSAQTRHILDCYA